MSVLLGLYWGRGLLCQCGPVYFPLPLSVAPLLYPCPKLPSQPLCWGGFVFLLQLWHSRHHHCHWTSVTVQCTSEIPLSGASCKESDVFTLCLVAQNFLWNLWGKPPKPWNCWSMQAGVTEGTRACCQSKHSWWDHECSCLRILVVRMPNCTCSPFWEGHLVLLSSKLWVLQTALSFHPGACDADLTHSRCPHWILFLMMPLSLTTTPSVFTIFNKLLFWPIWTFYFQIQFYQFF